MTRPMFFFLLERTGIVFLHELSSSSTTQIVFFFILFLFSVRHRVGSTLRKGARFLFSFFVLILFSQRDPTLGQHQGSYASQIGFSLSCCREGGFVPLLGNKAWETAWLPEDLTPKTRAPWESGVNFPSSSSSPAMAVDAVAEADEETKAFVTEMNENWNERRRGSKEKEKRKENGTLYSVENMKKDYR
ncbi:hypothetical protein VIGAN_02107400 [Vigna angularis var. angularis]|uniref:Uncharacterized protein n=2 Tax=Phaseolus angularis TaxID=3914 RepID=A0A0S3RCZ7_PHAAN|nr:hypothetical protein VIGAN_02107400 [Vigna angularis var. angularis]